LAKAAPPNVLERFEDCVRNYKLRFPQLAERFNDFVLARACGRFKLWVQHQPNVAPSLLGTTGGNKTQKQLEFVNHVRRCRTHRECFPPPENATKAGDRRIRWEASSLSVGKFTVFSKFKNVNIPYFSMLNNQ